jgi:hypothetical protein
MSYPDLEAVDKLVHEACASKGFVYTDRSGEELIDDELMKAAVYEVMLQDHVVDEPGDMTKGAITQHELYVAIFPNGPGANRQPVTEEDSLARDRLSRKLWGWTNTGVTGHVNKRVEAEGMSLIMCEASVARTYRSEETGRRKPTTESGRFLTDHPDLIATHSTLPRAAKLIKAAEAVAKHAGMVVRRHPELNSTVATQIRGALKQSQAALSSSTTKSPALTEASSQDDVA